MKLVLVAATLASSAGLVSSQLDFGESLMSKRCSFANFQKRVDKM